MAESMPPPINQGPSSETLQLRMQLKNMQEEKDAQLKSKERYISEVHRLSTTNSVLQQQMTYISTETYDGIYDLVVGGGLKD